MATEPVDIVIRKIGDKEAVQAFIDIGNACDRTAKSVDSANAVLQSFQSVAKMIGGYLAIDKLKQYADTYTTIVSRLKLVSTSTEDLIAKEKQLFDVANRTRTGFDETVSLYQKLTQATQGMSVSHERLLGLTETINQAITVSGASAAEASGGLRQLAQGLAAGALRGDELNSVMENFPVLANQIAKGMGVGIGALRQMGSEGKITAESILKSLEKQAPEIQKMFDQMSMTLSGAFTVAGNSIMRYIGQLDQSVALTSTLGSAVVIATQNLDLFAAAITTAAIAYGAFRVATFVSEMQMLSGAFTVAAAGASTFSIAVAAATGVFAAVRTAAVGLWATLAAHPFVLIATVIAGAVAALYTFGSQVKLTADGSITAWGAVAGVVTAFAKTLYSVITAMADTTLGANVLKIAVAALAAGAIWLTFVELPLWLWSIAKAATAALIPIAVLTAKFLALAAVAIGAALAANTLIYGWEDTKRVSIELGNAITDVASKAMKGLSDEMEKASKSASGASSALAKVKVDADAAGKAANSAAGAIAKTNAELFKEKNAHGSASAARRDGTDSVHGLTQALNDLGSAYGTVQQYTRSITGELELQSQVTSSLRGNTEVLTTYTRDMYGEMSVATEKVTTMGNGMKTVTEYARDMNGVLVEVSKTIAQSAKAADSAAASYSRMGAASRSVRSGGGGGVRSDGYTGRTTPSYAPGYAPGPLDPYHSNIDDIDAFNSQYSQQFSTWDPSQWERFATGGTFKVGGNGGVDTSLVQFRATPGEIVTVYPPGRGPDAGSDIAASPISRASGGPFVAGGGGNNTITVILQGVQDFESYRKNQAQLTGAIAQGIDRARWNLRGDG